MEVTAVVARGTGWLVFHADLRHVPCIRLVVDALVAMFRADPIRI
jgi:hypothetical protein